MISPKHRPPRIALLLLIIALLLHFVLPTPKIIFTPFTYFGFALIGIGFSLMMVAWRIFKNVDTAIRPIDKPRKMVMTGPYRFSRNPMYLGMILILFGVANFVGTFPVFVAPIAFFIAINTVFIPYEEKTLKKIFGQEYMNYKANTRRWI